MLPIWYICGSGKKASTLQHFEHTHTHIRTHTHTHTCKAIHLVCCITLNLKNTKQLQALADKFSFFSLFLHQQKVSPSSRCLHLHLQAHTRTAGNISAIPTAFLDHCPFLKKFAKDIIEKTAYSIRLNQDMSGLVYRVKILCFSRYLSTLYGQKKNCKTLPDLK